MHQLQLLSKDNIGGLYMWNRTWYGISYFEEFAESSNGSIEGHFQFFAYPEFSVERELIEKCTFDPTHILTNMHAHICKKGFQHVRAEAFLEVSERNNDLLSRALLTEEVDKQNLEVALHIFREDVEEDIKKNGDGKNCAFSRCAEKMVLGFWWKRNHTWG